MLVSASKYSTSAMNKRRKFTILISEFINCLKSLTNINVHTNLFVLVLIMTLLYTTPVSNEIFINVAHAESN